MRNWGLFCARPGNGNGARGRALGNSGCGSLWYDTEFELQLARAPRGSIGEWEACAADSPARDDSGPAGARKILRSEEFSAEWQIANGRGLRAGGSDGVGGRSCGACFKPIGGQDPKWQSTWRVEQRPHGAQVSWHSLCAAAGGQAALAAPAAGEALARRARCNGFWPA